MLFRCRSISKPFRKQKPITPKTAGTSTFCLTASKRAIQIQTTKFMQEATGK